MSDIAKPVDVRALLSAAKKAANPFGFYKVGPTSEELPLGAIKSKTPGVPDVPIYGSSVDNVSLRPDSANAGLPPAYQSHVMPRQSGAPINPTPSKPNPLNWIPTIVQRPGFEPAKTFAPPPTPTPEPTPAPVATLAPVKQSNTTPPPILTTTTPDTQPEPEGGIANEAPLPESTGEPKTDGEKPIQFKDVALGLLGLLQSGLAGAGAASRGQALDWFRDTTTGRDERQAQLDKDQQNKVANDAAELKKQQDFQEHLAYLNDQLRGKSDEEQRKFMERQAEIENQWRSAESQKDRDAANYRAGLNRDQSLGALPGQTHLPAGWSAPGSTPNAPAKPQVLTPQAASNINGLAQSFPALTSLIKGSK